MVFLVWNPSSRKKIAELFNEKYLKPLTIEAAKYFWIGNFEWFKRPHQVGYIIAAHWWSRCF